MEQESLIPIARKFKEYIRRRPSDVPVISATHVGTILGLNRYECTRDLILKQLGAFGVSGEKTSRLSPNDPKAIGIKYESKAVKLYCQRNRVDHTKGFKPPYLFTENRNPKLLIGGEGDFIFRDQQGNNVLLEIKCLVTRKITQKIPLHYWLQIQTMLYVYYLLDLDINYAVYCKNIFDSEGNLMEFWEKRVDFDLDYFKGKVLPILQHYNQILSKVRKERQHCKERQHSNSPIIDGPIKRGRPIFSDNLPPKRSCINVPNEFFKKTRKTCTSIISRVNHTNIYSHFLGSTSVFGPQCLNNYLKNNHLRDWYYYYQTGNDLQVDNTPLSKGDRKVSIVNTPELCNLIKPALKDSELPLNIINIEESVRPSGSDVCDKPYYERFSSIKYKETLESMNESYDIILGGQLYNPEKGFWVNYDVLIKNSCLKDVIGPLGPPLGPSETESSDPIPKRPFPKHYTPMKIIPYNYNTDNMTTRKARLELIMELETLNFYYSNDNKKFLVLDASKKITEVDISKFPKLTKQYESGMEWLGDLTDEKSVMKADPPSDTRLYPNSKVSTRDIKYEEFKTNLIEKNNELTTLWSISNLMRDKLINSKLGIKSTLDLEKHIDKKIVRNILGNIHPNIKNMLIANRTGEIVKMNIVRNELKDLKQKYEIFLDFEFTPDFIYVIGLYVVKPSITKRSSILERCLSRFRKHHGIRDPKEISNPGFKQFVLKDNSDDSHADLLNEFAAYIKDLTKQASGLINCYHWGQVEERLVKTYLPDIFNYLNFIDLHEMIVDHALAIPNCKSYTIKDVARSLKNLGHINTVWEENTDGYWCNQTLNRLLTKNDSSNDSKDGHVELKSCDGFNKILEYNHTDCKVLYDLVKFFRTK